MSDFRDQSRSESTAPAPITDKMDAEELRQGHDRLRARLISRNTVAGIAAVIVASGLLGIGFAEMRRNTKNSAPANVQAAPMPVARESKPIVRERVVDNRPSGSLTVEPEPSKRTILPETPRESSRNNEPDIRITPVPRHTRSVRTGATPTRLVSVKSTVPRPAPTRLRSTKVAKHAVSIKTASQRREVASRTPAAPTARGHKIIRVAQAPRVTARIPAASRMPRERDVKPQPSRDLEYHPTVRAPRNGPETASFTPMRKERIIAEPPRSQPPAPIRSDYFETPRRDSGVASRNFDDESDRTGHGLYRDEPRETRKSRQIAHEPTVKRRICVDTGWLAGDLCPRTAMVMAPESRLPTRRCRVHVLP